MVSVTAISRQQRIRDRAELIENVISAQWREDLIDARWVEADRHIAELALLIATALEEK